MQNPIFTQHNPYLLFNVTSLLLCILILWSLPFVNQPLNELIIPVLLYILLSVVTLFVKTNKYLEIIKICYIFALGITLRIINTLTPTWTDVYWVTEGSVNAILHGANPYPQIFPIPNNPGDPATVLAYLPFTIFYQIPFHFLGDIRYGIIFADVGIAILLYLIARPKGEDVARALAGAYMLLIFALNYGSTFVMDYQVFYGITDPIWIFLILISILFYTKNKQSLSGLMLGLSIATKQFCILFFIVMLFVWLRKDNSGRRQYKPMLIAAITPSLIFLPFLISSPHEFIYNNWLWASEHVLSPSLGLPQWNLAILPQLSFIGINVALTESKLIQAAAVISLFVFLRKQITTIYNATNAFTVLFITFLIFNNFSQMYYWFATVPFVMILFLHRHVNKPNSVN